jgi:DNA-binding NarL/FixJ family response regulator
MNNMVESLKNDQKSSTKSETHLTEREIQIVRLLSEGLNSQEIGGKLSISKRTVDNHRINILQKLNTKNVAGIIKYAILNNLI